jgi:adenosylcobinamide hydrolase
MRLSDIHIEKGEVDGNNYVAIRFPLKVRTLASTILNGGLGSTDSVLMVQVPMHYDHADPVAHLRQLVSELGMPSDTVCFMTAADLHRAFSAEEVWHNGTSAISLVTAGISNSINAGESSREGMVPHRQVGTINIVVITDKPLEDCGLANAIMTVTEAKTAALRDHGVPGTGTTSDAVLVVCPQDGERCAWSGTGSDHGISMAMAVRRGVGSSISKWNGGNGDSKNFLRSLAIRGVTLDHMWGAVEAMGSLDPAWDREEMRQRFEAKLVSLAKDINVNALIQAAIALEEKGRYGQLYGLDVKGFEQDPVHLLADELLGIALAEYVGGTRCLFEYVRYDKKKPGVLSELGPFMDDIVAALIGATMSTIYSELLEGEGRLS